MAKGQAPRKRRTRPHVIAAQSVNHVERFILDEEHSAERIANDYGYDLVMFTFDDDGNAEEGAVYLQLKASENLRAEGKNFVFQIDVRDYSRWTAEPMPVFLILYDATKRKAYWLYIQKFFADDPTRKPSARAKTIRVRVPQSQVVSRSAIRMMRACKKSVLEQIEGVIDHD